MVTSSSDTAAPDWIKLRPGTVLQLQGESCFWIKMSDTCRVEAFFDGDHYIPTGTAIPYDPSWDIAGAKIVHEPDEDDDGVKAPYRNFNATVAAPWAFRFLIASLIGGFLIWLLFIR